MTAVRRRSRTPYTLPMIGTPELLIVLLVVLVIFGGSQLPKLARGLGSAQREFKKGLEEGAAEDDKSSKNSDKSKSHDKSSKKSDKSKNQE